MLLRICVGVTALPRQFKTNWLALKLKLALVSLCVCVCVCVCVDRLCGLVVRVLGYTCGGHGSIPGTTRKKK
jgi:hypothetical protein